MSHNISLLFTVVLGSIYVKLQVINGMILVAKHETEKLERIHGSSYEYFCQVRLISFVWQFCEIKQLLKSFWDMQ